MKDLLRTRIDELLALRPGEDFALAFDGESYHWDACFVRVPGGFSELTDCGAVYEARDSDPIVAVEKVIKLVKARPTLDTDPKPDTRTDAQRRFDAMTDDLSAAELAHFYRSLSDAYPGELIAGFVRARDIVVTSLTQDTIKLSALANGLTITGADIASRD